MCSSCLQWVFIEKSEYTQIVHVGKGSDVEVVELWPRCLGFLTSFKPQEARWNLRRWPAIIENQDIIWGYPALCKCIHAFGCFHAIGYPTPILAFHRWVHSREMLTITFTIFFAIERSSWTGNWRQHRVYSGNLTCFSILYQCLPAVTMCFWARSIDVSIGFLPRFPGSTLRFLFCWAATLNPPCWKMLSLQSFF